MLRRPHDRHDEPKQQTDQPSGSQGADPSEEDSTESTPSADADAEKEPLIVSIARGVSFGNLNQSGASGTKKFSADGTYTVEEAIDYIGFGRYQVMLLFLAGLCWMADAVEMLLLSFLSPTVGCVWKLRSIDEATLVTVVFVGMMVGSLVWGKFADAYGRRAGYIGVAAFTAVTGLCSGLSPSFPWLLFTRALVGVGIGGLHVSYTLFSEFLPSATRPYNLLLLVCFWSLGSALAAGIAWAVLPTLGWQWFIVASTAPFVFVLIGFIWVPESPRYLLVSNQYDKAIAKLQEVAEVNGRPLPPGSLALPTYGARGLCADLFSARLKVTTGFLWTLWFVASAAYYGIVLIVPQIYADDLLGVRCGRMEPRDHSAASNPHIRDDCKTLFNNSDFLSVLLTSTAELPGLLMTGLLVYFTTRKNTISALFGLSAIGVLMLLVCTTPAVEAFFMGWSRAFLMGAFQSIYIYSPEVYPTIVRALGLGACSSFARMGGMLTPFVAQVLAQSAIDAALVTYAGLCLVAVVLSQLLPIETRGRRMPDTVKDLDD